MSALDLSVFAMTATVPQPKAPADDALAADKALIVLCNLLLDMHWRSLDAHNAKERAKRIATRLDNPAIGGTPEQRGAAEIAHHGLMQTAKRETQEVLKAGRSVSRIWKNVREGEREWLVHEIAPVWADSHLWKIVRVDPICGRDPVWARLLAAAGDCEPANPEPCVF